MSGAGTSPVTFPAAPGTFGICCQDGLRGVLSGSMDIHFFEVFEEEEEALRACLPPEVHASFHRETVQESGRDRSPGGIVSIRTQSVIPSDWVHDIDAILTRSTGYDHVLAFLDETGADIPSGNLP